MIVNTAYFYMGGGAAVNPNLWQDGVSNYPVEFTYSSISSEGLKFTSAPGAATFSELPLTHFNSLTLTGRRNSGGSQADVNIDISFYSSDNMLIGAKTATFLKSGNSVAVDIPSSAKIPNAKIKIEKSKYGADATLSSALLS